MGHKLGERIERDVFCYLSEISEGRVTVSVGFDKENDECKTLVCMM